MFGDACFRPLEKRTLFPLSEGCCLRTLGYDSDIGSVDVSLKPCMRIVQQETRQSWHTNQCYYMLMRKNLHLGMNWSKVALICVNVIRILVQFLFFEIPLILILI